MGLRKFTASRSSAPTALRQRARSRYWPFLELIFTTCRSCETANQNTTTDVDSALASDTGSTVYVTFDRVPVDLPTHSTGWS